MKKLSFGLAFVLLSFLFCAQSLRGQSVNKDTLAYNWYIVKYQEGDQPQSFQQRENFRFNMDTLGNVDLYMVDKGVDTLRRKDSWELKGDSIFMTFERLNLQRGVDSLAYKVENDKSSIDLFEENRKIASMVEGGIESQRALEVYHVSLVQDSLILRSAEQSYVLQKKSFARDPFSVWDLLRGILGIMVMVGIAYLFSTNRKAIDWRLVGIGLSLQLVIAILVLQVPAVGMAIQAASQGMVNLLNYSEAGAKFMFGDLADTNSFPGLFAFQILPTIVFFSAIMSLLYYLGVLQRVVYVFAWVMSKTMRLSGAESLSAAGNIFVGQTEAPLLIKPYLDRMTRSEIMSLMTGGFATIAGGVFAAYVTFLGGGDAQQAAEFAKHLITASVMSAPAAIVMAKILVPETEEIDKDLMVPKETIGTNILDALSNGITDGLKLAVNVGVMLMVFTAVMAMLNSFFGNVIGEWTGLNNWVVSWTDGRYQNFDLTFILGLVGAPFAWLMGVPNEDILLIGQLLGEKTILNEFYAYTNLGIQMDKGVINNYKSVVIATYALCGFANFASIGIQIGGIGALSVKQRKNLSELSLRALLGGTFAAFLTASIAGMLIFV